MNLSRLRVPFTCLVVSEATADGCLRAMARFESIVDSYELNLPPIDPAGVGDVLHSTSRPCLVTHRRARFMEVYGYSGLPEIGEEERAEALRRAVGLGAAAVDLELDAFRGPPSVRDGPTIGRGAAARRPPAALSTDRVSVEKQSRFAAEVRGLGAEVVFSCHTGGVLRESLARRIVEEAEARGGQFAKVVSLTPRREDVLGLLGCAAALRGRTKVPFTLMNVGVGMNSARLLSLLAGSSWVYCRPSDGEHVYEGQPRAEDARLFLDSLAPLRAPRPS
ncbi:MAG: type I 3-dehydroquinate dehydratase [Nitrososphaerales archaeon]|jgi:3-dehydroquinate dehydratase